MNRLYKSVFSLALLVIAACSTNISDEDTGSVSDQDKLKSQQHPEIVKHDSTENEKIYARYLRFVEVYKKKTYIPEKVFIGQAAELEPDSHPDARTYKTAFSKGLARGANFAGSYVIVSVGCGTGCQKNYALNVRTGEVLDKVQSKEGAFYQPESRLFIANPPDSTLNYTDCIACAPQIYLFENEKFNFIASDTL